MRFENDGQRIVAIEPGQEGSILLHNALNDLHPKVKKFVTALSITGDLMEAALAAGLSQAQVAAVLPGLKVKLGPSCGLLATLKAIIDLGRQSVAGCQRTPSRAWECFTSTPTAGSVDSGDKKA